MFSGGGQGGTSNAESPKEDEFSIADTEAASAATNKDQSSQKLPFCEIQWQKVTEFVKTRRNAKSPDAPTYKEKVRWSYSPDEGPKCTTETFLLAPNKTSKGSKKSTSPVQVWDRLRAVPEILIWTGQPFFWNFGPLSCTLGNNYIIYS